MFGVDELMKEGADDEPDLDFTKFLGPTVSGEWQPEEQGEEEEEKEVGSFRDYLYHLMFLLSPTVSTHNPVISLRVLT